MQRKQLYILRHGETDHNKLGIVQGSGVDAPLNETCRMQAMAFYEKYRELDFNLLICSALQRSYQTIEPFTAHGIPLERYPEINEINWGEHEGKKGDPQLIEDYRKVVNLRFPCQKENLLRRLPAVFLLSWMHCLLGRKSGSSSVRTAVPFAACSA